MDEIRKAWLMGLEALDRICSRGDPVPITLRVYLPAPPQAYRSGSASEPVTMTVRTVTFPVERRAWPDGNLQGYTLGDPLPPGQ